MSHLESTPHSNTPVVELTDAAFLTDLDRRGIRLEASGDRLQVNAPSGAVDAELRSELLRRKAGLLTLLAAADANAGPPSLAPSSSNERVPQTPAQQGMWLFDRFNRGNTAYNIPEAFHLDRALDATKLQHAIDELLLRHDALRTSFYEEHGDLFGRVCPTARAILGVTDLSALAHDEGLTRSKRLIRDLAREPFDLASAPLVRFHLFQLRGGHSILFYTIHHIIADGPSLSLLRQDLLNFYDAAEAGRVATLPHPGVQFTEYAHWFFHRLKEPHFSEQLAYWRQKLTDAPASLPLRHSRLAPAKRSAWGATQHVAVDPSLREALNRVGHEEGATPFMSFLTIFALVLYGNSGAEDFCIGSPITYRKSVETERTIGLFVNMLALRCRPEPGLTFRTLLRQIRSTCLDAFDHSEVPFQWLQRVVKPDRSSGRSPIFQVLFVLEPVLPHSDSGTHQLDTSPGTARYDLTLHLYDRGRDGLSGFFEFCTDLFSHRDMEQVTILFSEILQSAVSAPDAPLSEIVQPQVFAMPSPLELVEVPEPPSERSAGLARRLLKRFKSLTSNPEPW